MSTNETEITQEAENLSVWLGSRIKTARERAGLSQTQVAELSGIPVGTIRAWEQGTREPMALALILLAGTLCTTPCSLLDYRIEDHPLPIPPKRWGSRRRGTRNVPGLARPLQPGERAPD